MPIEMSLVKRLFANNKFKEALDTLKEHIMDKGHDNEWTLLSARYINLNYQIKHGILSTEDAEVMRNKFGVSLLQLITEIEEYADQNYEQFLPPLPSNINRPSTPFVGLNWFTRAQARIFFGRSKEIHEIYCNLTHDKERLVLVYGQSGVGKSSLLHAGLYPRLESKYHICYLRRDRLIDTSTLLQRHLDPTDLIDRSKPLLIILDQLEEILINPIEDHPNELSSLLGTLKIALQRHQTTHFILSFRKEFLAEIKVIFDINQLDYAEVFVQVLDTKGIHDAIVGVANNHNLNNKYRLRIEDDLPQLIASDISRDKQSHVAPLLQIILRKMWDKVVLNNGERYFDKALYETVRKDTLDEVVEEQLAELSKNFEDEIKQGLALEVLKFYTSDKATSLSRKIDETFFEFSESPNISALQNELIQLFLLTKSTPDSGEVIHLSHDALGPIIQHLHANSDAPAQRAIRILDGKKQDIFKGREVEFSKTDIHIISQAHQFIRTLKSHEKESLAKSKEQIEQRELELSEKNRLALSALSNSLVNASKFAESNAEWSKSLRLAVYACELDKSNDLAQRHLIELFMNQAEFKDIGETISNSNSYQFNQSKSQVLISYDDGTARLYDHRGRRMMIYGLHEKRVSSAIFSPDEKMVLTCSDDHTLRLWSKENGSMIAALDEHNYPIKSATFSPDSQHIVTIATPSFKEFIENDERGKILIWKTTTGNLIKELSIKAHSNESCFFSSCSQYFMIREPHITFFDIQGNKIKEQFKAHFPFPNHHFIPNDSKLLYRCDNNLYLWDYQLDRTTRIGSQAPEKYGTSHYQYGFTDNFKKVYALYSTSIIKIWDISGDLITRIEDSQEKLDGVYFSENDKTIFTTSKQGTIKKWNLEGQVQFSVNAHQKKINHIQFYNFPFPIFLSHSEDGFAKLWHEEDGRLAFTYPNCGQPIIDANIHFTNKTINLVLKDISIRAWHLLMNKPWQYSDIHIKHNLYFSPDGNKLGSFQFKDDKTTILTKRYIEKLDLWLNKKIEVQDGFYFPSFSPDGQWISYGNPQGEISILDMDCNIVRTFKAHTGKVDCVIFAPDSQHLISIDTHGFVPRKHDLKYWDINGRLLWEKTLDEYIFLNSFSSNGLLISGDFRFKDNTFQRIFASDTGRTWTEARVNKNQKFLAFSPNEQLAFTGHYSGHATLWNIKKFKMLHLFQLDEVEIFEEAWFTADGNQILSLNSSRFDQKIGVLRLWNLTGQLLHTFEPKNISLVNFDQKESKILYATHQQHVKIIDLKEKVYHAFDIKEEIKYLRFIPNREKFVLGFDEYFQIWPLKINAILKLIEHNKINELLPENLELINIDQIDQARNNDRIKQLIDEGNENKILHFAKYYQLLAQKSRQATEKNVYTQKANKLLSKLTPKEL